MSTGTPIYPWDKWFKQKGFVLNRPKDYDCLPHGMAQQIRNAASTRGIKVSLKIVGETINVVVTERKTKKKVA